MGRPLLPVGPRVDRGRQPRLLCVATNLDPDEVTRLDAAAARAGCSRAEFIRRAVFALMEQKT